MAPGSAQPSTPHQAISCRGGVSIGLAVPPILGARRLLGDEAETRHQAGVGQGVDRRLLIPIEFERAVGEQHHHNTIAAGGRLPHQTRITVDEHARTVSNGCDRNESRLAVCGMRLAQQRQLRWCDSPASAYRIAHTACRSQSVSCLLEAGIQAMSGGKTTSSVQSTAILAFLNSDGTWSR